MAIWCGGCVIHIRRGAICVARLRLRWARGKASEREASNSAGLHAFLCLVEMEVNRGVALAAYRWAAYGG